MSTTQHIEPRRLEQYMLGGLDDVDAAKVEAHASDCEACGAALRREAQLEQALSEAGRRISPNRSSAPRRRPQFGRQLLFAAAAAVVVSVSASRIIGRRETTSIDFPVGGVSATYAFADPPFPRDYDNSPDERDVTLEDPDVGGAAAQP